MYYFIEAQNSNQNPEVLDKDVCIICYSHNTKVVDGQDIVCKGCGAISDDFEIDNAVNEMVTALYHHNKDVYTASNSSSSLSGAGNTIITTYDKAMDFSKSGLISGRIASTDSNNKKVNVNYAKLAYTERNNLKNISTNREINITEGITTILKITEKLSVPHHIGERAANIFRMFYPKSRDKRIKYVNITNLLNNKKRLGSDKNVSAKFVAVSCVYFALREEQEITSLIEFVNIIMKKDCIDTKLYTKDIVKKIINKIYNTMIKEFGLQIVYPDTRHTINHICNSYKIDESIKRDSIYLYETINQNISVFQGTAPRTIAIVLIYFSHIRGNKPPTFIKKTDLSIITLKKLYMKYLDNLFAISEINDSEYENLKEGLSNGYKIKALMIKQ